ncbi:hypothetical protein AAHE18_03G131700 [Arachis hypogaea]
MRVFSWNCRGAVSQAFTRSLKEFCRVYKPDFVILQETRCSGDQALNAIRRLGFEFFHIKNAVGFSGGIWILWKDPNLTVRIILSKTQFVHLEVWCNNQFNWLLTAVYASPQERLRRSSREEMIEVAAIVNKEWLVVGDFNDIACMSEKKGGERTDARACIKFKEWINACGLIDLGFVGSKFT